MSIELATQQLENLAVMSTFAPVRDAYRLWLRTAPQLTLEVDDLTSLPVPTKPLADRGNPLTAIVVPAAHNNEGDRRNPIPGSAAVASQETA